jgi:hypothetical protein
MEGSHPSSKRPSGKGSVKAKTLEWLEIVASDKGRGIFVFLK